MKVKNKTSVSVRVEDYKRPTFEITFNPLKEAFCLGDTVDVTGNVKAYNGMVIQDVPLVYTVTRRNNWSIGDKVPRRLPRIRCQLDAKGNFSIPVVLKPGADTDRMGGERFSYQIEVSVTGDAGETQTSQYNLSAARRAYFFMPDINRELCKEDSISGRLAVMNAVNETLSMEGMCRLYRFSTLKQEKSQTGRFMKAHLCRVKRKTSPLGNNCRRESIALSCRFVTVTARKSAMRTIR